MILRERPRAGVSQVPEIVQENVRSTGGRVPEELLVEPQRFMEGPDHLGDQVGLQRGCIDQAKRRGLQFLELRANAARRGSNTAGDSDKQQGSAQQGPTKYASAPVTERDDRGRSNIN